MHANFYLALLVDVDSIGLVTNVFSVTYVLSFSPSLSVGVPSRQELISHSYPALSPLPLLVSEHGEHTVNIWRAMSECMPLNQTLKTNLGKQTLNQWDCLCILQQFNMTS